MNMAQISGDKLRAIIENIALPIVIKDYSRGNSLCQWSLEKWCTVFGNKAIPFRTFTKDFMSDEPCWERKCDTETMTFKQFLENLSISPKWMYFDYKYLHEWFSSDSELSKEISWSPFGYPEKGIADTTLWVGSSGAHTPAHQDTYGCNVVQQIYGKKRWILFPPESGGLKPTRAPYEESSVYSELNFYCPNDLNAFKNLCGARSIELCAGDVLIVPRGWWHYVQNIEPCNITLNMWLPHEEDNATRVSEALVKVLVAQICKDLPENTVKLILNPNEDNLGDIPLAALFLQLEAVAKTYLDSRRKSHRMKRQKTCDEREVKAKEKQPKANTSDFDINEVLANKDNGLQVVPHINNDDMINILQKNIETFISRDRVLHEDEVDGSTAKLCFTKALINSFCEPNVINIVKENLFARLS